MIFSRVLDIRKTTALQKGGISSATAEREMIKTYPLFGSNQLYYRVYTLTCRTAGDFCPWQLP